MGATVKDVAEAAGVSIATVSKYINGGNLREKYRSSVARAIEELHYSVNEVARNLKTNRTRMIGVMVSSLSVSYSASIATEAQKALAKYGYTALIMDFQLSRQTEKNQLEALIRWKVDGIILAACFNEKEISDIAAEKGIPLVLVDNLISGRELDAVVTDNYGSVYEAVNRLADNGHTRIAALVGPEESYTAGMRKLGYEEAMKARGLETLSENAMYNEKYAIEATTRLMQSNNPPTALLSTNYNMTKGMLRALKLLSLNIPDDIAVAVYDEIEFDFFMSVPLTTIRQSAAEVCKNAVDLLIKRIEDPQQNITPEIKIVSNDITYTDSIKNKRI